MPRIAAPTIAEHVARQEAAVLRSAAKLFAARGFARVTMADIAADVGLKRSSLYRYFPDKDHLLLACFRNEIDQLVALGTAGDQRRRSGVAALRHWLTLQFDYATDPEHRLFAELATELGAVNAEVRGLVVAEHERLYASADQLVARALADAGQTQRDPSLVTAFVVGLLRAATEAVGRGVPRARARRELERDARAVVERSS